MTRSLSRLDITSLTRGFHRRRRDLKVFSVVIYDIMTGGAWENDKKVKIAIV